MLLRGALGVTRGEMISLIGAGRGVNQEDKLQGKLEGLARSVKPTACVSTANPCIPAGRQRQ